MPYKGVQVLRRSVEPPEEIWEHEGAPRAPRPQQKGKRKGRGKGKPIRQQDFEDFSAAEYATSELHQENGFWQETEETNVLRSQRYRRPSSKAKGRYRGQSTTTQGAEAEVEEVPTVEDESTDHCWRVLGQTVWVEDSFLPGSRRRKAYYLYWENDILCVQSSHGPRCKLPSIDGGLRWGIGGRRNQPPRFTLAFEDAEEDKMTWRKSDGSVSHVWLLQEVNVKHFDVEPLAAAPASSSKPAPDAVLQGRSASRRRPGRRRSLSRRREGPTRQPPDYKGLVTDRGYSYLAGSTWIDEMQLNSSGELKMYSLEWIGEALHVHNGRSTFPLPSIEGGLRWGPPGPKNAAPKFTLADEDMEPHRLRWRGPDGRVSHVWYPQESDDADVATSGKLPGKLR